MSKAKSEPRQDEEGLAHLMQAVSLSPQEKCTRCGVSLAAPTVDDLVHLAGLPPRPYGVFSSSVQYVVPKRHVTCPGRWTEHRRNESDQRVVDSARCEQCYGAFRLGEPYVVEFRPGDAVGTHCLYHEGCGPEEAVKDYGLTYAEKLLRAAKADDMHEELKRRALEESRREDKAADRLANAVGPIADQLIEAFGLVHKGGHRCNNYDCVRCYVESCKDGDGAPADGVRLQLSLEQYKPDEER